MFSSCLIGSPLTWDILSRVFVKRENKKLNLHLLQTTEHVKNKDWQVFLLSCAFADEVGRVTVWALLKQPSLSNSLGKGTAFHSGGRTPQILSSSYPLSVTGDLCNVASSHTELLHPTLIGSVSHFCLLSRNADEKRAQPYRARTPSCTSAERPDPHQLHLGSASCQEQMKAAS